MNNFTISLIIGLILLCLISYILYLKNEIKDLQANELVLTLSVESLEKQNQHNDKFIGSVSSDLQACLDSRNTLAIEFDSIARRYRETTTEPIQEGVVINATMREELRNSLTRSLPTPRVQ